MNVASRPRIGLLWGAFPWSAPPRKVGKLLSMGAIGRTIARALGVHGTVVPWVPSPGADPTEQRAALAAFLRDIDFLWADLYPPSGPALQLRHDLDLPCPALLFAGGTMPKGAEAMLFPWHGLLRPTDTLIFTCAADRAIWQRLVVRSILREGVVPLAVDETVFHNASPMPRAVIRTRHGLPIHAPLLLYVGRLNIQKGLHHALRLLAAARRVVPDAHLCLVGEEDDIALAEFGVGNAGYVARLRALAADLGVADALTFVGPHFGPALADLYRAADLLLNLGTYHRENFGLAAAEAAACGLPAICTAWGGFKDVVRQGATGYLIDATLTDHGIRVDWATGADLAVALLRDPARRASLGAAAAAHAQAHFAVAALARSLGPLLSATPHTTTPTSIHPAVPAYEPSAFARRYEAHKRACGWYAPRPVSPGQAPYFTPMFTGDDYALYETLIGPYATDRARDLAPDAIAPDWRPYFPSGLALDPTSQIARDPDLIWPHERALSTVEWALCQAIDGETTVASLARHVSDAMLLLHRLHTAGFVLFRKPPSRADTGLA